MIITSTVTEDEITKQKTDEILLSRQPGADESLNIKKFLSPVPPEDDKAKAVSAADNIVEIEKEGTGDVSGNGRIETPYCCQ